VAVNTPANTASISDVLSAIKNIVTALSTASQNYLNVQGITNSVNISTPTIVKSSAGRIAQVSVIVAGSATGKVYDSNAIGQVTRPIWVIPQAAKTSGEPFIVNMPVSYGIVVIPGTGQTLTVSYS
jgi:hypothetical protein